jgi:ADP-ribosylglycohydrolase
MPPDALDRIEACLLGAALGDSLGLPFEGLTPDRIRRLVPGPLGHRFLFGRGMVSDDTDHSLFVLEALLEQPDSAEAFAEALAWRLKRWLLCLPAGIGFATLRGCLRLWAGYHPRNSGVWSAGNGPAMRSAILGAALHADPARRRAFVKASAQITHRDPRAEIGALAIAEVAAHQVLHRGKIPDIDTLQRMLTDLDPLPEWRQVVIDLGRACAEPLAPGHGRGISGYVFTTVSASLLAWYRAGGQVRETIESAVRMGGDTDTVASIAGALAGASQGTVGLPADWLAGILDYPHGVNRIRSQVQNLGTNAAQPRSFPWTLLPRGLAFTLIVLLHGARRLLPPF